MRQPIRRVAGAGILALLLLLAAGLFGRRPTPTSITPRTTTIPGNTASLSVSDPGFVSPQEGDDLTRPARPLPPVASRLPVPTSEVILFLTADANPRAVGAAYGLRPAYPLPGLQAWVYQADSPEEARRAQSLAVTDPLVISATLNRHVFMSKLAYIPNDPYYPTGTPATFPGQWHLLDANLPGAWAYELTGKGVTFAICDDGLQTAHPDLAGNYDVTHSLNYQFYPVTDTNVDPFPAYDGTSGEDRHGTCVGGVAAAVGGNGVGVTGAAPKATLAVQRLDFTVLTDAMLAAACAYHSSGGNTAIKIKNHSYGATETFIEDQAEMTAIATSAAAGTIHVFAAGNGLGTRLQDSNKLTPSSSPDGIAVAAIDSNDVAADYSSFGANVLVAAPSSSSAGFGVTTTDRTSSLGYNPTITTGVNDPFPDQNYTSEFGGTSSAAPLVSGIMVLGKQAKSNLTLRMAQHALVRSADLVDSGDLSQTGGGDTTTPGSAWKTNAAGFRFNQRYGFGRINAGKFIQEVVKYADVTPLETATASASVAASIPDNNATGLDRTFTLGGLPANPKPLESIQVALNLTHARRGDLEALLTSPAGTVCRLIINSTSDTRAFPEPTWPGGFTQWTLLSNAFWGESPVGTWHLRVRDVRAGTTGTWNSFSVVARMGQPVLDTTPPTVTSIVRTDPSVTSVNPVHFDVAFSEFVTGVDVSDFTLTTTGPFTVAPTITSVSGGPFLYTVTVNRGSGPGTITLNLLANGSIKDGNGNALAAGLVGPTYTVVAPCITSVTTTTPDGLYTVGAAIDITISFSSPVSLVGGNLNVSLNSGATLFALPFTNQSSITLAYVVAAGQVTSDLSVVSPLTLSAGTLRDASNNNVALGIGIPDNLAVSHAIAIDAVAPVGGTVLDGYSGPDLSTQTSTTTLAAHWSGYSDAGTGIAGYRWGIGTSSGAVDVLPLTDVGMATSASTSMTNLTLTLTPGTTYFVTVEARDVTGAVGTSTSNGVQVLASGSTLPAPPGRLLTFPGPTSVRLDWTASPSANVTFYRVWRKPSASPWSAATLIDNLAGLTTTVSGLTIATSYDFELRAVTAAGDESPSLFATVTTVPLITVGGTSYGSVQAAITAAAASGGTVTLQAGTYTENLTLPGGVTLTGIAPQYTIITAANAAANVITATGTTTLSTISQLTITGGLAGIGGGNANLRIRNVVIHHNSSHGISSLAAGQLEVVNCTIMHNGGSGILAAGTATIRNVISGANTQTGISAPVAASLAYNDAYANGTNYSAGLTLTTSGSVAVTFTNEATNNYIEALGSVSVDAGDPADPFSQEPAFNGDRVNIGAFGNTLWAATSPGSAPLAGDGGGGGGGGCGLTGLEVLLLLGLLRLKRS